MFFQFLFFEIALGLHCPEPHDNSVKYEYTDRCLYVYNTQMNWVDAEKECQQIRDNEAYMIHGDMVSVHTEEFHKWLYDKLTSNGQSFYGSYWLGMRAMCATCPLTWVDGGPVDYESWQPGEPSNPGTENCVELHTFPEYHTEEYPGLWNDMDCSVPLSPICAYYPNNNNQNNQDWPKEGGCPKGWTQFAGNCYVIPITGNEVNSALKLKTYQAALDDCQKRGEDASLGMTHKL